jgi:hypothetical protein
MRIILGIIFVAVGLAWGWQIVSVFRKAPRSRAAEMLFDFASGYAIDLILILALECLGILMIVGR